jgi:hypothetical protein
MDVCFHQPITALLWSDNLFSGAFVISRRSPGLHPVEGDRGFFVTLRGAYNAAFRATESFTRSCELDHIGYSLSALSIGGMESWVDGIVTITNAVFLAAYVAITLGYVALYDLGLSGEKVRGAAMIAVILIAATVAVDFLGKKLRKAD